MIEFEPFVAGLARIGVACGAAPAPVQHEVYHLGIGRHVTAEEWDAFTRWAIDPVRWSWFPRLREIQDALREFRGERPLLVEATDAYERVLASGVYTPEGGTTRSYRAVREACGEAAAEAFLAAGGHAAFASTWDEAKRRERFVAAYTTAVRESPGTALLPAGPTKALPAAESPLTREEAAKHLECLRGVRPVNS